MGTIKLLTMAVLTILTQKYLRNKWLPEIFLGKETIQAIQDKNVTYIVPTNTINNQLKD
jgi:hypothetical protein